MTKRRHAPPGPVLGSFELGPPLGRGGMSRVWRGRDPRRGIEAALKVMVGERARELSAREALRHEVRAMAGLSHPHVVLIFDFGVVEPATAALSAGALEEGAPWLAMELVRGGTLRPLCGALSWPRARSLLLSLLTALAHAHARGVVHLDLKPDNVLLPGPQDLRGGLKLADFGISRALAGARPRDLTRLGASELEADVAGTPTYMSPEQLLGEWRDFGPWTDLYALGCLAWELVTGKPPFPGTDLVSLIKAHLYEALPPLSCAALMPVGLEMWLGRLLEKDPGRRFQRAADAAWALRGLEDPPDALGEWTAPLPSGGAFDPDTLPTVASLGGHVATTTLRSMPRPWGDAPAGASLAPVGLADAPEPPPSWQSDDEELRLAAQLGAGLSLFGLRSVPLVARRSERDVLWGELLLSRQQRRPRAVLLRGAAGTGKSRLARWLAERADEVGAALVLEALHSRGGSPGDGLGAMLLRLWRCAGLGAEDIRLRVTAALGSLGEVDVGLMTRWLASCSDAREGAAEATPGSAAERLASLVRVLAALSLRRPLVVLLDDVQWGMEALSLVHRCLTQVPALSAPVLFVLTLQEEVLSERPAERAALELLPRLPGARELRVKPLTPAEQRALIAGMLHVEGPLARQLAERTAGNPLFAVQLVTDCASRGLLVPTAGGYRLKPGATLNLPDDLHAVFVERLSRALAGRPPWWWEVLELAATLGQTVDGREWRRAAELSGGEIPEALVPTLKDELLLRASPGVASPDAALSVAFVHGMLRESLLRLSSEVGRRRRHHERCAAALEELYGAGGGPHAERLALHLEACGRPREAFDALEFVAPRSHLSAPPQVHAELLERMELLLDVAAPPLIDRRRAHMAFHRARQAIADGRDRDATIHIDVLAQQARALKDGRVALLLERCRGDLAVRQGKLADARVYWESWLALHQRLGSGESAAMGYHGLAKCLQFLGDLSSAHALCERGLAQARARGDTLEELDLVALLAEIKSNRGDDPGALAMLEGLLVSVRRLGVLRSEALALALRGQIYRTRDQLEESLADLEAAIRAYRHLQDPILLSQTLSALGDTRRSLRQYHEAEQALKESIELLDQRSTIENVINYYNLAMVYFNTRRIPEGAELISRALAHAELVANEGVYYPFHIASLVGCAHRGDFGAWDEHFAQASRWQSRSMSLETDDAECAQLAGDLALSRGEIRRGRAALQIARELWRLLERPGRAREVDVKLTTSDVAGA